MRDISNGLWRSTVIVQKRHCVWGARRDRGSVGGEFEACGEVPGLVEGMTS